MKQLLLFFVMVLLVMGVDLYAISLDQKTHDTITVTIEGEVDHPGSYQLPLYASLQELLDEAGTNENADLTVINPEMILKDKDLIIIPSQSQDVQRISINTADLDTLCMLKGIGPSTAQRIIDYRNEHGLFQNIEDIMNFKGIGTSRFEAIKDRICL